MDLNEPIAKRHREDQGYDRVSVDLVPRFKTSDLSGSEWRVSAVVRFYWKGVAIRERRFSDMKTALAFLPSLIHDELKKGDAVIGSGDIDGKCFQPGCPEDAVSTYRLKKEFSIEGFSHKPEIPLTRRFCKRHLDRGDADHEDSNDNYTVVEGPGPDEAVPDPKDQSPATFIGVIGGG